MYWSRCMLLIFVKSILATEIQIGFQNTAAKINEELITPDNTTDSKVNVTVFYESFCPGSKTFFTSQLGPAVESLSEYLNLSLVPYGFATELRKHGVNRIICQHGPVECLGNKIHACVLSLVRNTTRAVLFNVCMMEVGGKPAHSLFTCGDRHGLYTGAIWECATSSQGTRLLRDHGSTTSATHPTFVPYTLLNGIPANRRNLMPALCERILNPPRLCVAYNYRLRV